MRRRAVALLAAVVLGALVWLAGVGVRSILAEVGSGVGSGAGSGVVNSDVIGRAATDSVVSDVGADVASVAAYGATGQSRENAGPEYHIVRAGDTLWSIARQIRPDGDVRPIVDELAKRAGGANIEIGQKLRIDGFDD